jgi:elongation factor Ts
MIRKTLIMQISASQVKDLRERTGVGMMECKKALTESSGDMEKAILWLREHGMARAQKKAGRVTSEGIVEVLTNSDRSIGVVLEVNCETDFVSKNDDFQKFVKEAVQLALAKKTTSVTELNAVKMASGVTVADTLTSLIAKIGENLQLRRVAVCSVTNGVVASYTHMGGKIGTLVGITGGSSDQALDVAKDVAMHVAAASPKYLSPEQVDVTELEQEQALAKKKLLEEGKPEAMVDKIVAGQMNKFYKEICLIEQAFVKDPKISVKQYVATLGNQFSLIDFKRFQLGEGIEKAEEDFASEVAKLSR